MLIGELADRVGTSTRTLRYYEEHGLVRSVAALQRKLDEVEAAIERLTAVRAQLRDQIGRASE
ncbi:MerR family DNA-binding transcriptional regulator [Nocardia sp. CA-129566]|uniref:MerR family DNA-binding transcriptional regulator n=1 Tax=Nocardia sp. CA-129566 TaxID=3239976 RepID=UPI003D953A17